MPFPSRRARAALSLLCTVFFAGPALAQTIADSTEMSVRTLDPLRSTRKERGRSVRAMVLAPVMQSAHALVAPRTILEGTIEDAGTEKHGDMRHFLRLHFTSLLLVDGTRVPISARVTSVDNSRETVDSLGRILAPPRPRLMRAKATWASLALGTVNPVAAAVFFATLRGEEVERHRRIDFAAGTDMTVRVLGAVPLPQWPEFREPEAIGADSGLASLVDSLPFRATAAGGKVPSDVTNVAFIASEEQIRRAFEAAGWLTPARGSVRTHFKTFVKAAEGAGYKRQPVSRKLMFGRPPDLVFERVTDTFAKRHHIRIWRTSSDWEGIPVWAAAATHDVGIEFSRARHGFSHRIDEAIDAERDKVVSDLVAALQVRQLSLVPRAPVPGPEARGSLTSDWRVATIRIAEDGAVPTGP